LNSILSENVFVFLMMAWHCQVVIVINRWQTEKLAECYVYINE